MQQRQRGAHENHELEITQNGERFSPSPFLTRQAALLPFGEQIACG